MNYDDDEDDDLTDREDPDESDMDADDDPEFVPCPHCGKSIPEEAERCYHCAMDVSISHSNRAGWIIVVAVLLILAVLSWFL